MLILSEIYNGEYKTCPRCKGHKLIRGQKINNSYKKLPNYKKIDNGSCFLCNQTGQAFYTIDNRVLKAVIGKNNKDYIIEFDSKNGNKIGLVPKHEYINHKNNKKDINTEQNYILTEEDLFPDTYEMIWFEHSKVADVIFEEYPNAKAINLNKFYDYETGDCINFLFYYDKNGIPIKPFYINPLECEEDYSQKGIVLLNDYIFGVSGSYFENDKKLILGIKMSNGFKYFEINDIEYSEKLANEVIPHKTDKDSSTIDIDNFKKNLGLLILKDIYFIFNIKC